MRRASLMDRVRYAFDNTISRGPAGLILWLAIVSILLILSASLFVFLMGGDSAMGFPLILWNLLFQTLTPNPVDPQAGPIPFLGAMLFVTIGSLLLVSVFIGILTNAIDHRIQDLRKGRSTVLENDHSLILGWSSQIFTIVSELVIARANHTHSCIVVLADKDKVEMEDEIRAKVPHPGRTRIVCRTGSPLDPTDLEIANPHAARSIIILAPEGSDPDTYVVKTMLALTHNPSRKSEPYHIVANIHEPKNMDIARMAGREEVEVVLESELISRVTVQTCRQTGLSVVYTELLNFEGDEIYFKQEPALVGKTFGETLTAYEDSSVIGLFKDGQAFLNPPMDTRLAPGDQIIAISEDDDTIHLSGLTDLKVDESAFQQRPPSPAAPERTLILGWNHHAPSILRGLDDYVAPGSQTTIVANVADVEKRIARAAAGLRNQSVTFKQEDTTSRHVLNELSIPTQQHVIVLSYSDTLGTQEADAQTLITLLHLRDIRERSDQEFSIVSEMLDVRNRNLADVTRADDFIVSDQLVSLVLAQVSENKYLNAVFTDLFDPEGSEVYLRPAEDYVCLGQPVNMYTVVESARRQNHIALGYRLHRDAHEAGKSYGVVVNPDKSNRVTFDRGDKVIVVAEH